MSEPENEDYPVLVIVRSGVLADGIIRLFRSKSFFSVMVLRSIVAGVPLYSVEVSSVRVNEDV